MAVSRTRGIGEWRASSTVGRNGAQPGSPHGRCAIKPRSAGDFYVRPYFKVTMKRLRNISRIDNEINRTHAWFVIVQRNNNIMRKMFSDGTYGGKRKALQAATSFHAQLLAGVSQYEYQIQRRSILRRNNRSGIPGVARYDKIDNPKTGRRVVFWLAHWVDEHGASCKRKFSVLLHGERKAKQLAIAERERQLIRVCEAKGSYYG
ncbi:MAG: AP2 domain-containing protein [Sulfurimicrobium sp.]|nr:AP2 domain-containing protein [Sulfurimicrobium sp.]